MTLKGPPEGAFIADVAGRLDDAPKPELDPLKLLKECRGLLMGGRRLGKSARGEGRLRGLDQLSLGVCARELLPDVRFGIGCPGDGLLRPKT